MVKTKTLRVKKKSIKNTLKSKIKMIAYSPTKELLNKKLIQDAIGECLKNNDSTGVVNVLHAYFEADSPTKKL